ncbi:hypothetical protein LguiA_036658 [Lonicera macranthoides]
MCVHFLICWIPFHNNVVRKKKKKEEMRNGNALIENDVKVKVKEKVRKKKG